MTNKKTKTDANTNTNTKTKTENNSKNNWKMQTQNDKMLKKPESEGNGLTWSEIVWLVNQTRPDKDFKFADLILELAFFFER